MDLQLRQRDVADLIGVDSAVIWSWENGRATPSARYGPAIEVFLEGAPLSPGTTRRSKLRYIRWRLGLNQQGLAEVFGVHRCTIASWEYEDKPMRRRHQERMGEILEELDGKPSVVEPEE
jgi:DNA-binding XRE family transcriptional regulator